MKNSLTPHKAFKYFILLSMIAMALVTCAGASTFAGGDGSAEYPYQIETVGQLQNMELNLSAHYVLSKDIDASGTSSWNNGTGFYPIGRNFSNQFSGSFDGQGYNITGLYINRSSGISGLFGVTNSQCIIENVGLIDHNMTGSFAGGLVGMNQGGNLIHCYATGNVAGLASVGCLVGMNQGNLTYCYATGNVSGDQMLGGLVGQNTGHLTHCYATGNVNGINSNIGGLVGMNQGGNLIHCYATGNVTGSGYVGGLIGSSGPLSQLSQCYATGNVTGSISIGGLVGQNMGNLIQCYARGNVTGSSNIGGLVGSDNGLSVTNCYATGNVNGSSNIGGLAGGYWKNFTQSYWDTETTGQTTSFGSNDSYGKSTDEMKTESTYVDWNFTGVWALCDEVTVS